MYLSILRISSTILRCLSCEKLSQYLLMAQISFDDLIRRISIIILNLEKCTRILN